MYNIRIMIKLYYLFFIRRDCDDNIDFVSFSEHDTYTIIDKKDKILVVDKGHFHVSFGVPSL